jgi:N-acetylmuramoyl-L-alanine amidase
MHAFSNMTRKFLFLLTLLITLPLATYAFTVVLDAGHGGQDAGAVGSFSKEKNINLRYTLALGDLIQKNHPDVKVTYTRNKDVFVNLNERARIANKAKADLFISIHTNASKNKSANGMETFTLGVSRSKENMEVAMLENSVILLEDDYEKKYEGFDPNSTDSYIMFEFMKDQYMDRSVTCADLIQTNMIKASKRNDRGVRQAGFLVLRATSMPSVLIELGFISNKEEEKYLNDSDNQAKVCKAIYQAFANYKHDIDKRNGKANEDKGELTRVDDRKGIKERGEITSNEQQVTSDKQQATNDKSEASSDKQQTTNDERQETSDKQQATSGKSETSQIEYYWQVLVSKNNYALNNPIFKGVNIGNVIHENNVYKYLVGPEDSNEAINSYKEYIKKHFPDAFIVVYQNGQRIAYQTK